MDKDRAVIIGHGSIKYAQIRELLPRPQGHSIHIVQPCKMCGSPSDVMLNGYCVKCDEELSKQFK